VIPSRAGMVALLAVTPLAIAASFSAPALQALVIVVCGLTVLSIAEYLLLKQQSKQLQLQRDTAASWSLSVPASITLNLFNASSRRARLSCYDLYPSAMQCAELPLSIDLAAMQRGQLHYKMLPLLRGEFQLASVDCRLTQWLWIFQFRLPLATTVKVYPNFATRQHAATLAGASMQSIGTIKQRQRGSGNDFHQLRQFRDGDSLRAVDWKATSRLRKLIAREYQDERDQQIVILLDCSRRMAHRDGTYSHLDETLNAVIQLAHIATQQGDAIGLMTFGGIDRWLPPVKGAAASRRILEQVYDIQATRESADFAATARLLMQRQRRRALVILVSNTRNDEQSALTESLSLLRKRHLVLLADLHERVVSELINAEINTETDALGWLGASNYQLQRDHFHTRLRGHGALIVDSSPALLAANLINRYQHIKALGTL